MCDICIAVYNPLKHKIKEYLGYPILSNVGIKGAFQGLRDRFRAAILIKNRYGISDRVIPLSFYGEIGLFEQLPDSSTINDYTKYLSLDSSEIVEDEIIEDEIIEDKNFTLRL